MLRAFCCSLLLLAGISRAQAAEAGTSARQDAPPATVTATSATAEARRAEAPLSIRRTRLDNGLRVVLSRDTSQATVAICVTYDVGTRNEAAAEHGFAQLFELLMFQGSRNVAAGEHARWIAEHAGRSDAQTTRDRTHFVDLLPANALALGLWLEADRMRSLELSRENIERQSRVARARSERQPLDAHALGVRELHALVFRDFPSYARGPDDGAGAAGPAAAPELAAVREFQHQFYAPNNAVLAVAGNFEVLEALNLVHEYFAAATPVARRPAPGGDPPEQTEPRSSSLEAPSGQPVLSLQGWAIPASHSADHYALELARLILGAGSRSRLQQLLVVEKPVARRVAVWLDEQRGPDLFGVELELADATDAELAKRLVLGQIAALGRFGPTALELSRAREQLRVSFWRNLDGNGARAIALADTELFAHDARLLESELQRYFEVSREDVQRAVARHLGNSQRSDVLVRASSP